MTDQTQAEVSTPGTKILVPITKGKGAIEIDTSTLPDDVYAEVVLQGLKVILNRGMSKITKAAFPDNEAVKAGYKDGAEHMAAEAMKIAETNVEAVKTSDIKFSAKTSKKKGPGKGAVTTEAMKLARAAIKAAMKENKIRVSDYKASEITKLAKDLIAEDESFVEQAEANLAAQAAMPKVKIDLSAIKPDAKLVATNEAKKSKNKDQLSATQAGLVKQRAKPAPRVNA